MKPNFTLLSMLNANLLLYTVDTHYIRILSDREKLFLYSINSGIFLYGIKFTLVSWIRGLKIYSYIVYIPL